MTLPPGQRDIGRPPRFGVHFGEPPPAVSPDPAVAVDGVGTARRTIPLAELLALPRAEITAGLHCVSGWSATGLRWGGVRFGTVWRELLEPAVPVSHVSFTGLDGYRAVARLDDLLGDEVLLADRLGGAPLDGEHGAPLRLVSPSQYGFVSVKHLCRIELHERAPRLRFHPNLLKELGLRAVMPHERARVWEEERHRYVPARIARPVYRRLVGPLKRVGDRPAGRA